MLDNDNSYKDAIEVEKSKSFNSIKKIERIEKDKERLTN